MAQNYFAALEITGENLEDLLAYDDLFLDYFNAFLSLPVFPQRLTYNRLTGAFEETDVLERDLHSSSSRGNNSEGLPYGPTDEERERLLEWARTERLPLFLSTQLFREFKLCKLLLRPLDDRYSASRGSSQQIRGYSRQSESYVSSLSNSADNSAHDEIDDDDMAFGEGQYRYSALFPYQRPGSRAYSVPTRVYLGSETTNGGSTNTFTEYSQEKSIIKSASHRRKKPLKPKSEKEGKASVKFENPGDDVKKLQSKAKRYTSEAEEAFMRHARVLSAPVNYDDYMRHPLFGDFDFLFGEEEPEPNGQVYVTFEDERVSEEQTETDVKNLEGRTRMSLQQLKEQILGTQEGMEGFKDFLSNTAGYALLNFWVDCEYYKDAMENFEDESSNDIRSRLFRDIQDKYKMNLTIDAKNHIAKAASNANLSHTVFIRTQYDVLRRLRAYWVPRYLIHVERETDYRQLSDRSELVAKQSEKLQQFMPFFPSISLVSSMPVLPDDVLTYSKTKNWEHLSQGGRRLDSRVTSAKLKMGMVPPPTSQRRLIAQLRFGLDRFQIALASDKLAGGPFQHFLEMQDDKMLLSMLLFWQSVTEYGAAEDRSADRLLRLCHAWTIYNNHIAPNCFHPLGFSPDEQDEIHRQLLNATDFIEASIFNNAKQYAMNRLQQAWIRYLKEDLKGFLDAHVLARGLSPPPTADVIDITVLNDQLIISRPDPWVKRVATTDSEKARRIQNALADDIDSEKRAELRMLARLRRKDMERERRKAIRNAYRRVREAKKKKGPEKEDGEEDGEGDPENKSAKPPPPFAELVDNRSIMKAFKKHLQDTDDKEHFFMIQLFNDVEKYLSYGSSKNVAKKKDAQATLIYKTYSDPHGKKKIAFNDKLQAKLSERPKTPVLKEMQHYILPKIDEVFKPYLVEKAAEHGMDARELVNLSQAELTLRLDATLAVPTWKKGRKGKTGRGHATKDDKDEFNKALKQAANGNMTLMMLYFYKYLLKHGEEDGSPNKDKDFFFYIECQKFKECSQPYADEDLLRRKVQAILDCFLESAITPTLQIDISSACHEKTLKAAQKYLAGKEVVSNIFDEAMVQVYPDLLGYWAGFRKTFQPPEDPTKRPITKYQKLLKSRLEKIDSFQLPSQVFPLPPIPEGAIHAYSFSLAEGVKWRKEAHFMGSMELSNSEAGSIIGSPIGDRSETVTAATTRRPSISKHGVDGIRKKQKSHPRIQLPGVQPVTPGESIASS